MDIGFLLSRIRFIHIGKAVERIKLSAKLSGKPSALIAADMLWCAFRYGAGPADYSLFAFYGLNGKQRRTYVTRAFSNALIRKYNSPEGRALFGSKSEFDKRFSSLIGRRYLELPCEFEPFAAFAQGHENLIYKPNGECCGRGVEKLTLSSFDHLEAAYLYLSEKGSGVLEDFLLQHPEMSRLYPHAVNTVRIVTILNHGIPKILFTYLRIGNGGKSVDNFNNGGLMSPLAKGTGEVLLPAVDKAGSIHETHPYSGTRIIGFRVPLWENCLALVKAAALIVPEAGYIGWDVAITPDGPVLIEGNAFPGYDIYQMPCHLPDGYGVKPLLLPYLKGNAADPNIKEKNADPYVKASKS